MGTEEDGHKLMAMWITTLTGNLITVLLYPLIEGFIMGATAVLGLPAATAMFIVGAAAIFVTVVIGIALNALGYSNFIEEKLRSIEEAWDRAWSQWDRAWHDWLMDAGNEEYILRTGDAGGLY